MTSASNEEIKIETRRLFALIANASEEDKEKYRGELTVLHQPLVRHIVSRFSNRTEPHEDLMQVGTIGLLKAIIRWEEGRGNEFSTFATPTILGEVKRHFRDRSWTVRVPRRLQEMRLYIARATDKLLQINGHAPTIAELAAYLDVSVEEIIEGIESNNAYHTQSLDTPEGMDAAAPVFGARMGDDDPGMRLVENRESLRPLLARLSERERYILGLRFYSNMSQTEIARELQVSQMHVSRILNNTLAQLREGLFDENLDRI